MTTIVASRSDVPDFEYEYHTITIDTIGQASANTFTVYLNTPLRNVVQARLLGARINTVHSTEHCYVSIDELDSNFADRAIKTHLFPHLHNPDSPYYETPSRVS